MKRAALKDVAARAGVSRAAVSKVIRNAYGTSAAMREKVERAMAELDYRPIHGARSLRGKSYTLGVLMPDLRGLFFPDIFDGIANHLEGTQYQTLLGNGHTKSSNERELVETMMAHKMDGVILISPRLTQEHVERIVRAIPTVFIGRHQTGLGFDTVNNDDERGGYIVVEHLAKLGHRRIAHFIQEEYGAAGHTPPSKRFAGYVSAMRDFGLEEEIQTRQAGGAAEVRSSTLEMLQRPNPPTALFGWTDALAIEAMSAAEEIGRRVPEDVSVVGYDNASICSVQRIMLTSVDQSAVMIGEVAAKLLIERIEGRREEVHFVTPPRLVVRNTTGVAPNAPR